MSGKISSLVPLHSVGLHPLPPNPHSKSSLSSLTDQQVKEVFTKTEKPKTPTSIPTAGDSGTGTGLEGEVSQISQKNVQEGLRQRLDSTSSKELTLQEQQRRELEQARERLNELRAQLDSPVQEKPKNGKVGCCCSILCGLCAVVGCIAKLWIAKKEFERGNTLMGAAALGSTDGANIAAVDLMLNKDG